MKGRRGTGHVDSLASGVWLGWLGEAPPCLLCSEQAFRLAIGFEQWCGTNSNLPPENCWR